MLDADPVRLPARALLRERAPVLLAEVCAWAVGLSDRPHLERRDGRLRATGTTLGLRAAADLPLADEDAVPPDVGEARPGTLRDALGALGPDGRPYADRLDDEVLRPYVLQTCVLAAERARADRPVAWAELLDELGEDGSDLPAVVRAAEWEAPLGTLATELVLAALGDAPLVEVEAEGLPLSLVRAAEATLRAAVEGPAQEVAPPAEDLAGALFLAEAALREAGLPVPVPVAAAPRLLAALLAEGLEDGEVRAVLAELPVHADTAEQVARELDRRAG